MEYQEKHLAENIRNDMGMNEEELQEMREADVDDETLHALSLAGRVEWKKRILYYANLLNSQMKKILDNELALGNRISDAHCDYPELGSIHVTLAEKFKGNYKEQNVKYTKGNDPHYWFEDYTSLNQPRHMILH